MDAGRGCLPLFHRLPCTIDQAASLAAFGHLMCQAPPPALFVLSSAFSMLAAQFTIYLMCKPAITVFEFCTTGALHDSQGLYLWQVPSWS